MTGADIESLPAGTGATHKWHSAALVVAGSPGMGGAAALACEAAVRSGARMIHLSTSAEAGTVSFIEAVRSEPPLAVDADRFACVQPGQAWAPANRLRSVSPTPWRSTCPR